MDYVLPLAINLLGFGVGVFVGTVVHECGHAVVGAMMGCGPRLLNIGRGPIAFRHRFGRLWLVVRSVPFGGYVASWARASDRRAAFAAAVAAGPSMNLVLFAPLASTFFGPIDLRHVDSNAFVIGFAGAQLALAGASVFPHRFRVGRDRRAFMSDGLKLYLFARGRYPDEVALLQRTFLQHPRRREAPLPPRSPATLEVLYQLSRRDLALERWARADSVAVLRGIEANGGLGDIERQVVRTRLAIAEANPELF